MADDDIMQALVKRMSEVEARHRDPNLSDADRAAHYQADVASCFEANAALFLLIKKLQDANKELRAALARPPANRAERRRGN